LYCYLFGGLGFPVAGGLSQSAVNDKAGARTPVAVLLASLVIGAVLLFLTGLFRNLPEAVLVAVKGLVDLRELAHVWRVSRFDFHEEAPVKLVVCDLSSSPILDLSGSRMLAGLHAQLAAKGCLLRFVNAHAPIRDLMRAESLEEKVGKIGRYDTLASVIEDFTE
jgi:MFS superfamily sulfate permease-like transporter